MRIVTGITVHAILLCPTLLTDLQDSDTQSLIDQINRATGLGIRVSFGFLDSSNGLQDKGVLLAIQNSRGIYNTIVDEASSSSFINLGVVDSSGVLDR